MADIGPWQVFSPSGGPQRPQISNFDRQHLENGKSQSYIVKWGVTSAQRELSKNI